MFEFRQKRSFRCQTGHFLCSRQPFKISIGFVRSLALVVLRLRLGAFDSIGIWIVVPGYALYRRFTAQGRLKLRARSDFLGHLASGSASLARGGKLTCLVD
jgi:hypothetical protein